MTIALNALLCLATQLRPNKPALNDLEAATPTPTPTPPSEPAPARAGAAPALGWADAALLVAAAQRLAKPAALTPAETDTDTASKAFGWADAMLAVCFASASQIAIFSTQLVSQQRHLSLPFLAVSVALMLAFSCFTLSKFICPLFARAATVLDRAGVFFLVTGFFVAVSIPFPLCLKVLTWLVYALCLLVVLLCNYFFGY